MTFTYQWQDDVGGPYADLPGETNQTYVPIVGEVGKHVRVIATDGITTLTSDPVLIQAAPVVPPEPPGGLLVWSPPGWDGVGDPQSSASYPGYALVNVGATGNQDINAGTTGLDIFVNFTAVRTEPLRFTGHRNIVIIGAEQNITSNSQTERDRLGLQFLDLASGGIVHIEGYWMHGYNGAVSPKGGLTGGIKWRASSTILQWQNSRVDDCRRMDLNASLNHADIIQTFSGPLEARMYKFTGSSDYSGMKWMYSHIPPDPVGTRCGGNDGSGHPFCKPGKVIMRHVDLHPLANAYVDISGPKLRVDLNILVWPDTEYQFDEVWCEPGGGAAMKEMAGERDLNSLTQTNFTYQEFHANGSPYPAGEIVCKPYNYIGGEARSQGDYIEFTRPTAAGSPCTWGDNIWNLGKTGNGRMYCARPFPTGGANFVPLGVAGTSYVSPGYST